jgi:hypothetical protein
MPKRAKAKRVEPDRPLDSLGSNSYLHVKRIPNALFGPAPSIVETVFYSKVGHTFGQVAFVQPARYIVQDFLLDQTGASGADGKMATTTQFDLTTTTSYRFNVFPKDRSKRIKVVPPQSTQVFMGLDIGRKYVSATGDFMDIFPPNSFFTNLQGAAPTFTYARFGIGHNTNHWVQFFIEADLFSAFSFLGFTTIGAYPTRTFDPGPKSYHPYSTSVPFNLPSQTSVPYLMFSYQTASPTDPGPFVFLG